MRRLLLPAALVAAAAFATPALADPGDLDPHFGGGRVTTAIGDYATADAVAVQADGKIVAAGTGGGSSEDASTTFALARYLPNGTLDQSFGSGGKVTTAVNAGASIHSIALQPDGKIVAAGYTFTNSTTGFAVARYLPNGSLDPSFGSGGKVTTFVGAFSFGEGVAIQSDGKIVVAGTQYSSEEGGGTFALVRYNPNGSKDGSFGSGGVAKTAIGVESGAVDVAVRGDGKIVAGGSSSDEDYNLFFAVARYLPNGTPDPGFGSGGTSTAEAGGYSFPSALALQPDGKVVLSGEREDFETADFVLVRFAAGGGLDGGFGSGGIVTTGFGTFAGAQDVTLQTDGKIVAVGTSFSSRGGGAFALARYLPNGTLDGAFGDGGKVTTTFGVGTPGALAVALQGAKIVAAGWVDTGNASKFALARYLPNGALDVGFGVGGPVTTPIANGGEASATALQSDGKIVLAGYAIVGQTKAFALTRYRPDGSLDSSFGDDGTVTTPIGAQSSAAQAVLVLPSGRILAAGFSGKRFALVRYNPNGSLDPNFGSGGVVTTAVGSGDVVSALALQTDGKIVAAGSSVVGSRSVFAAARYSSTGALDPSFGSGGKVTTAVGTGAGEAHGLVLQPDGKLVLAGFASTPSGDAFALVRYTGSGALDSGFGTAGQVTTPIGSSARAHALALQADGKLVAAGESKSGSRTSFALVRYGSSGALDPGFGSGGKVTTQVGTLTDVARGVAIQPNGKIVAAGSSFQASGFVGGGNRFALVRYEPSGALATGFGSGGKVTTQIGTTAGANALALQTDGKIVVAGGSWNGSAWDFTVARYLGS